ncbi:response regulator [Stappia sp. GBMRC 2046]|uniref:Response regulator n=1 Tax=Stappia sediminis TaxID=2692190 RepID=A0A7X3LSY3_9HYPH|nr:response regulator [Stappia sediminis]
MEDLDVVVIDDARPMQTILRSTLQSFRVQRIRTFDGAEEALDAMQIDPPNLVLTDWYMKPMSGLHLLQRIRRRKMAPLCFLPILFVTAHGTRTVVEKALRGGAQNVLIKPVAPSTLYQRLQWTLRDHREFELLDDGRYVIGGMADRLDRHARKVAHIANVLHRGASPSMTRKIEMLAARRAEDERRKAALSGDSSDDFAVVRTN